MAIVAPQNSKRALRAGPDLHRFLEGYGIACDSWPVPPAVSALQNKPALTKEEQEQVMDAYKARLERERKERGYIQADMVVLSLETPNLEQLLAKFDKPHYHDDDEVRYIFAGEGVFGFEGSDGDTFTITVTAGDYLIVPARLYHWFTLTPARTIKAIRLFKDTSGWTPHYKNALG